MCDAKMPRPNTVLITPSQDRFKVLLFQVENSVRNNNYEVHNDLFIDGSLNLVSYSLLRKLETEKKLRTGKSLAKFEVVYTFMRKFLVKKARVIGKEACSLVQTNTSLQNFLDHLDVSRRSSKHT